LPPLPKSLIQLNCLGNDIIQIDDLTLLDKSVFVRINTDNLNFESLKKYRKHLIDFMNFRGNRFNTANMEEILHNINERLDLKNFEMVSGKNKEISLPTGRESIQPGNLDMIQSFITDRRKGGIIRKSKKQVKYRMKKQTKNRFKKQKQNKTKSKNRMRK
jgi:hypothetical protein